MRVDQTEAGASRAVCLQQVIHAEREGRPFLVLKRGDESQLVVFLEDEDERLWIGRSESCDVVLDWDQQVSRAHAELARVGGEWGVVDDGLSRNGTLVHGQRISGRKRLSDGDVIRIGGTSIEFRDPSQLSGTMTAPGVDVPMELQVTPMQRKVLVALCRPYRDGGAYAVPSSNQAIADELVLSIDAIKTHMKALYVRFGLEDLPQATKRVRLAERALETGVVNRREL